MAPARRMTRSNREVYPIMFFTPLHRLPSPPSSHLTNTSHPHITMIPCNKVSLIIITSMLNISLCLIVLALANALPDSFSWANNQGRNYIGSAFNQNNPHRCQSSWAIATTNVLSARLNIANKNTNQASPMIQLSPQSLLECDQYDGGCLGGEPNQALRWILRNGLPDSTCNPYKAKGYTNGQSCSAKSKCQSCWLKNSCNVEPNPKVYNFEQMSVVAGEMEIATEILSNGPVVCGISASNEFKSYTGGVLKLNSTEINHNHYVMIYGWGVNNTDKFWLIQNSYGPNWGEEGSARILRGTNYLGLQASCFAAKPKLPATDTLHQPFPINRPLVASQSQINPNYCQSSWAFAVVHALADSQLARSNGSKVRSFSVQALLNCGVGTCEKGGNPYDALTFISKYGIPEQGCQGYQAATPERQSCTAIDNCASCSGNSIFTVNCTDVKGYKRWKVLNFGSVSGIVEMSRQLFNHHSLICGVEATSTFKKYTGGVFQETTIAPKINHWVELVADQKDYWIGRNSWGTTWGINGFFKLKKGSLGIESKCYWVGNIF